MPAPTPLRLLIVEDSDDDALLIARELERSGYAPAWKRVDSPESMRAALESGAWDVITSDHKMPRFSAPQALALAQELQPDTPFLIVSSEINLNLVVTLLRGGAHDYIQKHELARLPAAVDRERHEHEARLARRRAEEALRASNEKFSKAFRNFPDSIHLTRFSDGLYLEVNEGFERLTGYRAEDVVGKETSLSLGIWGNPSDRERLAARLRQDGMFENAEYLARGRDGRLRPTSATSRLLTVDGVECVITFSRDLTRQKEAEEALRRHNRELTAINQIVMAVTTELRPDVLLDAALHGVSNLSGLNAGAVYLRGEPGLSLAAVWPPASDDAPAAEAREKVTASGQPACVPENPELGRPFAAAWPFSLQGKITGVLCLWSDSAPILAPETLHLIGGLCAPVALALENARLYEAVQRYADELEERVANRTTQLSAMNQELESYNYTIAHDLRAPLRAIQGFAAVLDEDHKAELTAPAADCLDRISANVRRMQEMIDGLLTLSRLTRTQIQRRTVDLTALARSIADELQRRDSSRKAAWKIQEGMRAQGDPMLLHPVFENLMDNAWKFTAKNPETRIEVGCRTDPEGGTEYFVRDNGVGFDPAKAPRLFEAFQRLHPEADFPGSGVGLASVKRILRLHGGRIRAESRPGAGATFYFTFSPPE